MSTTLTAASSPPPSAPLCDLEAEQSTLGALILTNVVATAYFLQLGLKPEHFYLERHRSVCEAIYAIWAEGQGADVRTISAWLEARGRLEAVGGQVTIDMLTAAVPSVSHLREYARIVKDLAIRRGMQRQAWQMLADADNPEGRDGAELVASARRGLDEVGTAATGRLDVSVEDALIAMTEEYEARRTGGFSPVRTGLRDLDRVLKQGLLPGNLYLIAGRPGMGKTAIGLAMTTNIVSGGKSACLYNLEMDRVQIVQRMSASMANLPLDRISAPEDVPLTDEQTRVWLDASGRLARMPLRIVDRSVRLGELTSHARYLHARGQLDVLIVDYLQLVSPDERGNDRYREVTDLSIGLKHLASDLGIPVIAMAQLNREVERRNDKRPTLADLRDSGQLEQDAHAVLLLFREDYYSEDENVGPSVVEIDVAKHRGGATGMVEVMLDLPTQRVSGRAYEN